MIRVETGDFLALAPTLPHGKADLLLCDPPYNVGLDYGPYCSDARRPEVYARWLLDLYRACAELAAPDATLYAFCPESQLLSTRRAPHLPSVLREAGWQVLQRVTWYRPNGPGPRKRAPGRVWATMSEEIVMCRRGKGLGVAKKAPWYHDVLTFNTPQSNHPGGRFHPAQKPVELYSAIIQAHRRPGLILDPCCGSGSALLAALLLHVDALGVEINPQYASLARGRVRAAQVGLPFQAALAGTEALWTAGDPSPVEEAENA